MVDTVLYFEGDRGHPFRILRAVKNRFGATDEIGVFEMAAVGPARGRQPVRAVPRRPRRQGAGRRRVRRRRGHAAAAGRDPGAGGAVRARHAAPRRGRLGRQPARRCCSPCSMRAAASAFAQHDVYLNVAGGLKITEPAADLAAAAALLSSFSGAALPVGPRLLRRDQPVGRGQGSRAHGAHGSRKRRSSASSGPFMPAAGELEGGTAQARYSTSFSPQGACSRRSAHASERWNRHCVLAATSPCRNCRRPLHSVR